MEQLFSCRNCVHNASQTLSLGKGMGFCLIHKSVIWETSLTTCKFLHRKDLPFFVVDDGVKEHAAEFAEFPGLVKLNDKTRVYYIRYSEKFAWERHLFDPVVHALAQYDKAEKHWLFIQAFSSGSDARRSVCYSSLIRRYVKNCGTWTSSYRLALAFIQDMAATPYFEDYELNITSEDMDKTEIRNDAFWDVIYARLATLQEYGWHASIEEFMWITDTLNEELADFDWPRLQSHLGSMKNELTEKIISQARAADVFFSVRPDEYGDEP